MIETNSSNVFSAFEKVEVPATPATYARALGSKSKPQPVLFDIEVYGE